MALYKSEFWVQMSNEEQPKLSHTKIYASNTDRKIKMHISNLEKFFPGFSSAWKVLEDGDDFKIWKRSIKKSILAEWNSKFDLKELDRFVIVKKALSDRAYEILEAECDNKPVQVYTTY